MSSDPNYQGGVQSPDPSTPLPGSPDSKPDPSDPPQTWKHPDDGKSLSEEDEEVPLKP